MIRRSSREYFAKLELDLCRVHWQRFIGNMLSASRVRSACPQCRSLVLNFYESGLLQLLPNSRAVRTTHVQWRTRANLNRAGHQGTIRQFSYTRQISQQATDDGEVPGAQDAAAEETTAQQGTDAEKVVRQARQTFGNTLPPNYLSDEEYKLYERLYGAPIRETQPEDVGIPFHGEIGEVGHSDPSRHTLYRETASGRLEEVAYTVQSRPTPAAPDGGQEVSDSTAVDELSPLGDAQVDYLNVTANNKREYDALVKLQRDFEASSLKALSEEAEQRKAAPEENDEEYEEEEEDDEYEEDEGDGEPDVSFGPRSDRYHPNTKLGKFKTSPSTLFLPRMQFIDPITELLNRTESKHIKLAAEKAFGAPGLPYSPATPEMKKNVPMKGLGLDPGHHRMTDMEADAFLAAALPGLYASTTSALVETRKRLGAGWIRGLLSRHGGEGPRVLDVGSGGAGLAAWQQVLQAEWDVLREEGQVTAREPPGKKTVIVGSDGLRHRISRFLNNTTFLPRLPDYVHSANLGDRQLDSGGSPLPRKTYDVIIASHTLMPQLKSYKRKSFIDNLWAMLSPEGGVLIVLEKGHPRGFEAVAGARQQILDKYIIPPGTLPAPAEILEEGEQPLQKEPGMIVAPCTNHAKCPMYQIEGESPGRKDFCHFKQRFIRPPFLQYIVGATHKNHEDIKFSFVSIRRGAYLDEPLVSPETLNLQNQATPAPFLQGKVATDRAFAGYENGPGSEAGVESAGTTGMHPLALPRLVFPPLKRRGHVTMDVCTPAGAIERWTIPKSFSKQGYRDARKCDWGDLWALGAKTRTERKVRMGRGSIAPDGSVPKNAKDGGVRSQRAAMDAKASGRKPRVIDINVDPSRGGVVGAQERFSGGRIPRERRTGKGGRQVKLTNLMEELGVMDYDDEEEQDEMMRLDAERRETRRVIRKERGRE